MDEDVDDAFLVAGFWWWILDVAFLTVTAGDGPVCCWFWTLDFDFEIGTPGDGFLMVDLEGPLTMDFLMNFDDGFLVCGVLMMDIGVGLSCWIFHDGSLMTHDCGRLMDHWWWTIDGF